jgi:hydrogenase expression/formation protein HypC
VCLGIPGRILELARGEGTALVDVAGLPRTIHVGLLADEPLAEGDWILIHAGVAMERIDEARARGALEFLSHYTEDPPA